jgi:23S rRNA pseudouridine955/2504/2580 synthase
MSVTWHEIGDEEADLRLDRWLRRRFPGLTQGRIEKLCRTGQIRLDGQRVTAGTRLAPGQRLRLPPLGEAPSPPPRPADPHAARLFQRLVLYEDDALIVIDKPPGLPTQGGPGLGRHLDALIAGLGVEDAVRPRLVHRLDQETSGLLVLGRGPRAAAFLARAFRERAVEKTYWAVVMGRPSQAEGVIDAPLLLAHGPRGARARLAPDPDAPGAARALTRFTVRDAAARRAAWLELTPLTGRTHQLRLHCAALGTPILGEAKYADPPARLSGFSERLHLHARALRLPHPAGGTLFLEAALPPHMAESFAALGFSAPPPRPPQRETRR